MDDTGRRRFSGRVGERWVIRYRLADGSATDATGWLEAGTVDRLRMTTRHGEVVEIALDRVVAARRAPVAYGGPDPARTGADELEQIAAQAWIADSAPLGEWKLRAGGGFTRRANSCLAVGDPGRPLAEALTRVAGYAAEHQIPARVQVVEGSTEDEAIRAQGWQPEPVAVAVLAVRLDRWLGPDPPDPIVNVSATLTSDWEEAYPRARPVAAGESALAYRLLTSARPRVFASLADGGRLVAIGRGQVTSGWLGISAVWVEPAHRRTGQAARVMRGLGNWAARLGARWAYAQVATSNDAALGAYQRIGFVPHHRYLYRTPPHLRT